MDDAWLQAAHEAYEWGHSQGVLTQPPSGPVASLSSEDSRINNECIGFFPMVCVCV